MPQLEGVVMIVLGVWFVMARNNPVRPRDYLFNRNTTPRVTGTSIFFSVIAGVFLIVVGISYITGHPLMPLSRHTRRY